MADPKPVDSFPLDRAWQIGRRIYVRSAYGSRLGADLRRIGANWDPKVEARWVGTTKRDQVVEALRAHQSRVDAVQQIKDLGLWIRIPYEAVDIRRAAQDRDAIYDPAEKRWAMRSQEDYDAITAMIRDRESSQREQANQHAETLRQQVLAESGRQPTGEWTYYQFGPLDVVGPRAVAEAGASARYPTGRVIKTGNQRILVLRHHRLDFIRSGDDMASGPDFGGRTGWYLTIEAIPIESTADEAAQDAEDERARAYIEADDDDVWLFHDLLETALLPAVSSRPEPVERQDPWTIQLVITAGHRRLEATLDATGTIHVSSMNSDDAHWDIHGYYITHPRLITWIKQIANRGERQHGAPHHGWRVSLNKKEN